MSSNPFLQLRTLNYPGTIDVVDAVMEQVSRRPIQVPAKSHHRLLRYAAAAAAVALICVGVNALLVFTRTYDTRAIAKDMTAVYNYSDLYYETTIADDIAMDDVALWIDNYATR